jgi:flagellar protein FliS
MTNNPYAKYKNTQVETANQEKLVLMLYNGAIKFINRAQEGLDDNDYETVNKLLGKSQAIINELMATLDLERGGEIAENLYNLYDYMNRQLIQANIKKEIEPMIEVQELLKELRSTWQEVMKQVGKKKSKSINNRTVKAGAYSQPINRAQAGGISIEG